MARPTDGPSAPLRDAAPAAPRFAAWWASLVYAVSTLLLAYPALGGLFLLNPRSDQYKAGYAFREFAAQSLRSGHGFPQWNPYIMGGLPYVAAMHGDIFYPTFLLRMIMPTDMAMTWEFPIHLFLCGLFTYLFLRAWGFSFYGALIGGLAYMLGGSIAGYAGPGHDGKLFVSTMLPLALLQLTRAIRDGRIWAWGALAVTIGLAVLSPHPQLLQYLLLTCGAFALYLAFATHPEIGKLPRPIAIRRLAFAAGSVVLGALMGAVQYWPAIFEYKSWSPRAAGHDYATATSFSFPIEETLNSYWPQFSGILDNYWGRNNIHFHSDYFGVVVLILFGAAFGATGFKSFRRFWVVTGAVALLWAFGGFTPFFHLVLAIVPGTKYFRAPSTIIYITAFAVSVLAAIGAERIFARRVTARYALVWIIASGVFALLMSVGGYNAISSAVISTFGDAGRGNDAYAQLAGANAGDAILGAWRSFFFVIAGAGLVWGFLTDRLEPRLVAMILAVLIVVDLWSIERMYWTFSPPASKLYATDPAIQAIKADLASYKQPARVWTEWRLGGDMAPRDPVFVGDALMSHDLETVGNYHGNELGMYDELLAMDNEQAVLMPEFWRHENVRYLYTTANDSMITDISTRLKLPAAPTKIAGPVRNAVGSMVFAYRLPGDNDPAWVASAMVKAPEQQALATILDPRFDPSRIAIVDSSADVQAQALQALPAAATTKAAVTKASPGAFDISLEPPASAGQALVVSENYFPGWHATADGKPAVVARMNFNLVGVVLPAGARTVQLRFTDAAYEKGKVVTLVALVVALVIWIGGWIIERRRRVPAAMPA